MVLQNGADKVVRGFVISLKIKSLHSSAVADSGLYSHSGRG